MAISHYKYKYYTNIIQNSMIIVILVKTYPLSQQHGHPQRHTHTMFNQASIIPVHQNE